MSILNPNDGPIGQSKYVFFSIIALIAVMGLVQDMRHKTNSSIVLEEEEIIEEVALGEETMNEVEYEFYASDATEVEPVEAEIAQAPTEPVKEDIVAAALIEAEEMVEEVKSEIIYGDAFDFNKIGKISEPSTVCKLQNLGVQFACNPDWKAVPSEEGVERIVIEDEPVIMLGISRIDKKMRFLNQMDAFFFKELGLYKEGFRVENVRFAGHEAKLVKAISAFNDSTQRRDYFYIHDGQTAHISFMMPNTEWSKEDVTKLKEIMESFEALAL